MGHSAPVAHWTERVRGENPRLTMVLAQAKYLITDQSVAHLGWMGITWGKDWGGMLLAMRRWLFMLGEGHMNRSQLLGRLGKAWNALKESYAGLSEAEMLEPGVTGTWSIKDIIAHVTSWEGESLKHLPLILAGEKPPRYSVTYGGIDAFNAQTMEKKRHLSLSAVLQQRDDTHRRLVEFILNVPEEHFTRETSFRRRLRLDTYSHYREHRTAIEKWREQRPAG
jgi:hypothetical protein